MRILYLGLPLGALCLAERGHRLVAIGLGHPDAPGARRVRRRLGDRALILGRPDLESASVFDAIASARPDALLSWFWPRRIPERVLSVPPRGAFGVHPSLLPRHRGRDPYFWALRLGDRETGVTLHRLEAAYDTGAIIASRTLAIDDDDDAWSLAKRLDRPSLALLDECAARLASGERLSGTPQDERLATEAPRPSDDDLALRFERPAEELVRLVRAAAPHPGAAMELEGKLVIAIEARVYERPMPRVLAIGEAVWVEDGLAIKCGDGAMLVTKMREDD